MWHSKKSEIFPTQYFSSQLTETLPTIAVPATVLEKVDPKLRFPQLMATTSKGRSQTMLTSFWATYQPLVDIGEEIPLMLKGKIWVPLTFCQRSLWTTPKVALARLQQLKYHLLKPPSLTIYYFTQIYIIAFKAISLLCTRIQPHNGLAGWYQDFE